MPPATNRNYWLCQGLGWGGYALAQWYAAVWLAHLPALRAGAELLALNALALLATHALRLYLQRRRWAELPAIRLPLRVLAASTLLAVPFALLTTPLSISQLHTEDAPSVGIVLTAEMRFAIHWLNWSALFATWQALYFLILSARRRRLAELRQSELTRELQASELRQLKSQLNPHFLFNALNTVRALIADDPARAQSAVTQLARTLRYTLSASQDELVTLAHELEIVDDYLALESLRLGDRLRVERRVAPEAAPARIPVMLLQGLVENAIKHGVAELPEGGVLRIEATVRDGALALEVTNPRLSGPSTAAGAGIGLANAQQRLRLLFGAAARLELDLSAPDLAQVRMRLPVAP